MICSQSIIRVLDNSGISLVKIIGTLGNKKSITLGDILIGVIKKCSSRSKIKKGKIVRVLLVNTKKSFLRMNGSYICFDKNFVVVLNSDNSPLGTTIFGAIPFEIKEKGFSKVASIAREII